jgi:hypothetical protein
MVKNQKKMILQKKKTILQKKILQKKKKLQMQKKKMVQLKKMVQQKKKLQKIIQVMLVLVQKKIKKKKRKVKKEKKKVKKRNKCGRKKEKKKEKKKKEEENSESDLENKKKKTKKENSESDSSDLENQKKKKKKDKKKLKKKRKISKIKEKLKSKIQSDESEKSDEELYFPKKSKSVYQRRQGEFLKFMGDEKIKIENESAYLRFFIFLSRKGYSPSTLWSYFGCLNRRFKLKFSNNLTTYQRLILFLKDFSKDFHKKKSLVFNENDVQKILKIKEGEENYLDSIIFLVGYYGLLRSKQIILIKFQDVSVMEDEILIKVSGIKTTSEIKTFVIKNSVAVKKVKKYISLFNDTTKKGNFFKHIRKGRVIKSNVGINYVQNVTKRFVFIKFRKDVTKFFIKFRKEFTKFFIKFKKIIYFFINN